MGYPIDNHSNQFGIPVFVFNNIQPKEHFMVIWNVFDKHFADEYGDVKLLGMFTVAGDAWAATKDLSPLDGLSGSKVVPFATMTWAMWCWRWTT